MEGNALQYPFSRHIAEPYVFELDLASNLGKFHGILGIHQLDGKIKDGKYFFCGSKRGLKPVELLRQVLDRVKKSGNVHIKRNNGSAGQRLAQKAGVFNIAFSTQIEQAEHRTDVKHIYQRAENAKHKDLFPLGFSQGIASGCEFFLFDVFPVKDLCDLDTGEVLRQISIDICRAVFYLTVRFSRKFSKDHREKNDEWHETKHHQCQFHV